jgi:predicted adenine nucleotide alpha hydrolase (AANH) superfamily ATPase
MDINYQKKMEEIIGGIAARGARPSLLLHSCCAPCSSYVLECLSAHFDISVFYYNPNIQPYEEYRKRADEQKRFLSIFPPGAPAAFIEGPYDEAAFGRVSSGREREAEGGARCLACYELRLRKTAEYAKAGRYDFFTTTLSVSPHKNARALNETGARLSEEYGVSYLFSDFKKKNGYHRSIVLSKEYGLYRQDFCGCAYSRKRGEAAD